jgi:hypothetical protein
MKKCIFCDVIIQNFVPDEIGVVSVDIFSRALVLSNPVPCLVSLNCFATRDHYSLD